MIDEAFGVPCAYSHPWAASLLPLTWYHSPRARPRHLRDLLMDEERAEHFSREHNGIYMDFSRQTMTETTLRVRIGIVERGGGSGIQDQPLILQERQAVLALRHSRLTVPHFTPPSSAA